MFIIRSDKKDLSAFITGFAKAEAEIVILGPRFHSSLTQDLNST